ncbi:MAG TPA: ectonucleotide pyrophosphatase/phosphodiesterase [Caulobacteraceae bacterium]|jgi:predicted AlkP superfamily pyrophosphatase or phosphodiesterase
MTKLTRMLAWLAGVLMLSLASVSLAAPARAPLILISLDGFRAEYLDRGETPALTALAVDGVRAEAMRPSFPSVTNPNHYTLLTGLYPDHHGVIDNMMRDPAMPDLWFGGSDPKADADPRWWNNATPLWVTVQRAGLKTASNGWPHDWVVIQGQVPTYLEPRNPNVRMEQQVDKVLAWLDLPVAQRPALIRLHLDPVDAMGHLFGPDSVPVNATIAKTDAALGRLVAGLKRRGVYDKVNMVIVSDHGMTEVSKDRIILLANLVDLKSVVATTFGSDGGVNPLPGHEAEVEKALLGRHAHLTCWRRGQLPAHLHYGTNPRAPAIFCQPDLGWLLLTPEGVGLYSALKGDHGYDPNEPDMWAIFIAHGPAFASGRILPIFDNVDVYPLLTRVLDVKAQPNDGHLGEVAAALRTGPKAP